MVKLFYENFIMENSTLAREERWSSEVVWQDDGDVASSGRVNFGRFPSKSSYLDENLNLPTTRKENITSGDSMTRGRAQQ